MVPRKILIRYLHDEVVEVWWELPIGRQEVRLRPDRPPAPDQEKQAQHEPGDENPLHDQLRLRRNYLGICQGWRAIRKRPLTQLASRPRPLLCLFRKKKTDQEFHEKRGIFSTSITREGLQGYSFLDG